MTGSILEQRPDVPGRSVAATPWAADAADVARVLRTDLDVGLSPEEAQRRLDAHGTNVLAESRTRSALGILWDQLASPIVGLLATAAVLAFLFQENVEGAAIVAVIFLNAAIGFLTERHAVRSMEALRELGRTEATVRRGGAVRTLAAELLVPGDVVVLDAGDVLAADVRILSGSRLQADESLLTGESTPVEKGTAPVPPDAPLAERGSMLFRGTSVTRGAGEGLVVATGMETELGHISALTEAAEPEATPLEKRLQGLARRLLWLTLAIAVAVAVAAVASGRGLFFSVEIAIALAVAAIPEGLPIVATIALARGMWRMAARNALIDRLSAVETLGSTTVILTDKTGTLTENRMRVVEIGLHEGTVRLADHEAGRQGRFTIDGAPTAPTEHPALVDTLRAGVLCNNATLDPGDAGREPISTGDPTEVALLAAGASVDLRRDTLAADWPEIDELAFDPATRRMATLHRHRDEVVAVVKGAPESVVEGCVAVRVPDGAVALDADGRSRWLARAEDMARRGRRVLALATRRLDEPDAFDFTGLTLLGLVGLIDPPRARVADTVRACRDAGVRIVMVTGDHGATALAVAREVGLVDDGTRSGDVVDESALPPTPDLGLDQREALLASAVIARASPRQKLDLIEMYQDSGAVVAMTGDGVNDAPALKKADIGIAMGRRGTQVAREAADMVLRDDDLDTIVAAIAQGRAIFANIRRSVVYLLSCNVSEILAVGLGVLFQGPLPVLPLQILFLNLVTDVFPALALGVGEGSPALMKVPPRDPRAPVLARRHWRRIFGMGAVMALSVLAALAGAVTWLGMPEAQATSVAFLTLAMTQLWHALSMRHSGSHPLDNEVTRNPWLWGALALCVGLLLLAVYWVPLAAVLSLVDPGREGWTLAVAASLVPLVVGQITLLRGARERE